MKNKKILFLDLDGTLLKNDQTISEASREAIRRVVEAGHYVALATGRPKSSLRHIVQQIKLNAPGMYVIACNGAEIYDCVADRQLFIKRLSVECEAYLLEEADKYGLYAQTFSETEVLASDITPELRYYISKSKMPFRIIHDKGQLFQIHTSKLMLISLEDHEALVRFQQEHLGWQMGRCVSFFSSEKYLEYCPMGATKGLAVQFLTQFLGVSSNLTYAVGDQQNDIGMIKAVYTGIAMKNAVDEVKAAADFVTENDNEHDGVVEVINKFIL